MWRTQNIYYELLQSLHPRVRDAAQEGDETARAWLERFKALGELLRVRME
jgi:hypothetical protein